MLQPALIPNPESDKQKDNKYNPNPMITNIEPTSIMEIVMLEFIKLNPSQTKQYSIGALADLSTLAVFIARDAIRVLNSKGANETEQEVAGRVMARIKNHVEFWVSTFKLFVWS